MDAILARFADTTTRDVQFKEQAPGPRGSPHVPHAPGIGPDGPDDFEDLRDTANTESCLSSERLAHPGHTGGRLAVTRVSNARRQSRQTYSKSGIGSSILGPFSFAGCDVMSDEGNALLALKNAWTGAVTTSTMVRGLDAVVQALPADTPLVKVDLEGYHRAALAAANAFEALRGLIEQLQALVAR
jgi:hypothetical protein